MPHVACNPNSSFHAVMKKGLEQDQVGSLNWHMMGGGGPSRLTSQAEKDAYAGRTLRWTASQGSSFSELWSKGT